MSVADTRPLFLQKARPRHTTNGVRQPPATVALPPSKAGAYAAKALAEEVATLAATPKGERNDQLNVAGFNLAQLVAGGYLNRDEVWNALHATALAIGLTEKETVDTLRSAFTGGAKAPRVVAELAKDPVPDAHTITPPIGPVAGDDPAQDDVPTIRDRFPALDWQALWADDTQDEWIVEPILPARRLVALFSPPKVGKSLLMLELAVQISRGVEVIGYKPDRPRRVLYVDFENDPRGDIRSRLQAMGITPYHLENLVYLSYPRLAYLDTNVGGLELLAVCQEYEVEVCVIDTISRAVNGEENDNDTWLAFYRNTGLLLKSAGIATIRLDHTGKDATKGMRGGSAKYGDVDAVWSMAKISDTTFKLECTANRLPIAEKALILERELVPALRHRINMEGAAAAIEAAVPAIVNALDALHFPLDGHGSGSPAAWKLLKDTGIGTKKAVEIAVARRKDKAAQPIAMFTHPTPYKD